MAREQNVNISIVDLIINLPFPHGAEEVSVLVQQNQDPWQLWEESAELAGEQALSWRELGNPCSRAGVPRAWNQPDWAAGVWLWCWEMSFPNVPWLGMALHAEQEAARHRHRSGHQGEHLERGCFVYGPDMWKDLSSVQVLSWANASAGLASIFYLPLSFLC